MTPYDLLLETNGAIEAVWYCPPNDGRKAVLLIETPGGPKRYRRVWLTLPVGSDDWTWFKPGDAVLLVGEP